MNSNQYENGEKMLARFEATDLVLANETYEPNMN